MFKPPKPKSKLQLEIDRLTLDLRNHKTESKEYEDILDKLAKLHKVELERNPPPDRLKKDTAVVAVVNILGIAMIIRHEHLNVIASKALSLVRKP